MRRKLLDVHDVQVVFPKQAVEHQQREIGKVLVIDGVELVLGDQRRCGTPP
jgi:hypothetical protein